MTSILRNRNRLPLRSLQGTPTEWAGKPPRVERPNQRLEDQWFTTSKNLSSDRLQAKGCHMVFLEGPPGSGKGDVLNRLDRIGYSTYTSPYRPLVKSDVGRTPLVDLQWAVNMMKNIEDAQKQAEEGKLKDKIAFFNRSLLTPYIYSTASDMSNKQREYFQDVMYDIKKTYSCSLVYCKSDPYQVTQRLLGRYELLDEKERKLREILGEFHSEDIERITARYAALEREMEGAGTMMNVKAAMRDSLTTQEELQDVVDEIQPRDSLVDAILHTTSTKQAVAAMLRYYGIGFTFDLSKFKVSPDTEEYQGRPGEPPKEEESEPRVDLQR